MAATTQQHTKEALRSGYLEKRKALGQEELAALNSGLQQQVQHLRLGSKSGHPIRTAHTFLPIASMAEPDTRKLAAIIDGMAGRPLRWVISKTERKTTGMYHFVFDQDTLIRENRWGIPEPLGGHRISEEEIDLILVPLLVFDLQGHRVGYGKGYYDRFLARCRPDALKVGISLFEPVPMIAGIHQDDIPLDACLTPGRCYCFNTESGT